ncbi:Ammonium transporter Rh type C-like [Homarus americanus]|uniref:Ammonium transporter Rh type C-like n=1 Tax=Homarus americanus TaxID=6706 RepID=A0A8J5JTG7_HOMAM|nr:Ammonium transporter Rh type C-like [Homarus americanus]
MEIVVLAGVGLRMAFLREYSYSSVGVSLLLTAMTLHLLEGCVVSVSVGVTHGALLGVASPLQLVLLTLLQVPVHTATHHLVNNIIQAVDRGGSLSVHMFGAVFGVSACRALGGRRSATTTRLSASKTSQVAAFIGTMVMVVYLPEVWSWRSSGDDQHRAQINTLLATLAAAIVALPASSIAHTRRKFSMSDIQCGVMGGSVAVAAVADMMLEAYGALLLGAITSAICVLTRRRLAPMLQTRLGVADTAGVGVSHGLAGAMGGLAGVVMAASASDKGSYGVSVYEIFPPMAPKESTPELAEVVSYYVVPAGKGRSSGSQAAHQLAAILAVLVISVVSGVLAGLLLRLPLLENLTQDDLYSDHRFWQIPARQSSPCRAHTQVGPHTHSHPHDPAHATTHHKHQQIQSLAHNNNTGP